MGVSVERCTVVSSHHQYYLFLLHCGATAYMIGNQQHMFVAGFGQYRYLLNVACE